MKFLFRDKSFSFELLRAAGYANYAGADLGEVLATARSIPNGSEDAWLRSWSATADRVAGIAEASLARGHVVSAREAYLRASNYYRVAEFFRRRDPKNDSTAAHLFRRCAETFLAGARLLESPFETVEIPYAGTTLPAHLYLVDDAGTPRPTVIYNSGFDSTLEEAYFVVGAAALRRGYNVLAFDGPGQGAALRSQGLVFRADWEAVMTPVIDFALSRPEVDPAAVSLFGYSLGGYLIARAAAFDHRPAALILDDGVIDFHGAFARALPRFVRSWIYSGRDRIADRVLQAAMALDGSARWALNNGVWSFGSASVSEFVRQTREYTLEGVIGSITTPALVLDADKDQFLLGQPQQVHAALKSPSQLVTLSDSEGAGEHCHVGAMARLHQVMFDWLDETVKPTSTERRIHGAVSHP